MAISKVTRHAIVDDLRSRSTNWHGRLTAIEFLSRLWNLESLPSTDRRVKTALEDITTHTVNWPDDWQPDWVFDDARFELMENDQRLLAFLAEMLHPEVRPDSGEARALASAINQQLVQDGYELVESGQISGRPIFQPRPTQVPYVAPAVSGAAPLELAYVVRQIARMHAALVDNDPELAIGTAKELLETVCKTVLQEFGIAVPDEVPKLVRSALDAMPIDTSGTSDPARAKRAIERVLGSLSGLGTGIAEVRNACGTGHGQHASTGSLDAAYARLVVNSTATLVTFLADRYRTVRPS